MGRCARNEGVARLVVSRKERSVSSTRLSLLTSRAMKYTYSPWTSGVVGARAGNQAKHQRLHLPQQRRTQGARLRRA
jgi:hypothetical protein